MRYLQEANEDGAGGNLSPSPRESPQDAEVEASAGILPSKGKVESEEVASSSNYESDEEMLAVEVASKAAVGAVDSILALAVNDRPTDEKTRENTTSTSGHQSHPQHISNLPQQESVAAIENVIKASLPATNVQKGITAYKDDDNDNDNDDDDSFADNDSEDNVPSEISSDMSSFTLSTVSSPRIERLSSLESSASLEIIPTQDDREGNGNSDDEKQMTSSQQQLDVSLEEIKTPLYSQQAAHIQGASSNIGEGVVYNEADILQNAKEVTDKDSKNAVSMTESLEEYPSSPVIEEHIVPLGSTDSYSSKNGIVQEESSKDNIIEVEDFTEDEDDTIADSPRLEIIKDASLLQEKPAAEVTIEETEEISEDNNADEEDGDLDGHDQVNEVKGSGNETNEAEEEDRDEIEEEEEEEEEYSDDETGEMSKEEENTPGNIPS